MHWKMPIFFVMHLWVHRLIKTSYLTNTKAVLALRLEVFWQKSQMAPSSRAPSPLILDLTRCCKDSGSWMAEKA